MDRLHQLGQKDAGDPKKKDPILRREETQKDCHMWTLWENWTQRKNLQSTNQLTVLETTYRVSLLCVNEKENRAICFDV